ncbi:MAG: class I SAM-dependent methyltransferase [Acidimicrobiales bacterium]
MPADPLLSPLLEVDAAVVSPDELAGRIAALLDSVTPLAAQPSDGAPRGQLSAPASVADLRLVEGGINPPEVLRLHGARGHAAWAVKRVVRKLTSWYVEPRWVLQRTWDARAGDELELLARQNLTLRLQVLSFFEQVSELHDLVERSLPSGEAFRREVEASIDEARRGVAARADVEALRHEVDVLLRRLGAAAAGGADIDYAAFEDRFRGSSDQIAEGQRHYLDHLPPAEDPGRVVDIGCGRGELLELLGAAGYEALGVDPDPSMVEVCQAKGLEVVEDDGLRFLERTKRGSLKAVFAIQVVEHLLTSELERLVRSAHDALAPGGKLIMETINPRSLHALGNHFYADTSHVRPVHPETLRFICEQVGFGAAELVELSPHPLTAATGDLPDDASGRALRGLIQTVFGHQDYAVLATK